MGGSNLADAVQVAARSFVDRRPGHKVVFMLTDGEENTSGEPAAAAKAAFEERGVRFFPLGLGSPDTGATIPLGGGRVMTHQGEAVQTTLDAAALKSVAQEGGGVYVPAETKRADMAEVYRRLIRPRLNAGATEGDAAAARATTVEALIPRFGWLAWPALLLLLVERLIAAWPARRVSGPMLGAALLSLNLLPVAAVGQETEPDPRAAYNAAVAAHAAGDAEAAQRGFAEAALRGVGRVEARARYNLARAAHVRAIAAANPGEAPAGAPPDDQAPAGGQAPEADPLALLDEAVREYAAALGADPAFDDARANLEAAARLREQLRQQQDQQQQEQEQEQEQEQNQDQDQDQESEESSSDDSSQEQEPQDSESSEDSDDPQESESESQNQEDGEPSEGEEGDPSESEQEQGESESDPADTTAGSEAPEAANQSEGEAEDSAENGEDDQDAEPATAQAAGQAAEGEPQTLSSDEAMKLLQRIRDQDLERRIEQYQREAQRQQRVEKDW